jgi:energy-coupling factor transporter transmembrane protein EcfT
VASELGLKIVLIPIVFLCVVVLFVYCVWNWRRYWPTLIGFALLALVLLSMYAVRTLTHLPASVVPVVFSVLFVLAAAIFVPRFNQRFNKRRRGDPALNEPTLPPPGWYPDPSGAQAQSYWDGRQWTASMQPPQQYDTGEIPPPNRTL